jgi:hypothetical protein
MLNTALFITKMEQYLVARGNTEGAHTLDDKVRKSLKFNIHDVLDTRAVELMVDKWSQFIDDNRTLINNPASQTAEIKSFIEINTRGRVTEAQGYLMGKVKQYQTTDRPERLLSVVEVFIDLTYGAQEACKVAKSCGYRISAAPIAKRDIDTSDMYSTVGYSSSSGYGTKGPSPKGPAPVYHKGSSTSKGSAPTSQKSTTHSSVDAYITDTKEEETLRCNGCGNIGHHASICAFRRHKYFNKEDACY